MGSDQADIENESDNDPIEVTRENAQWWNGENRNPVGRFYFKPEMTAWDPTGQDGGTGVIANSRKIDTWRHPTNYLTNNLQNRITPPATVDSFHITATQYENTLDTSGGSLTVTASIEVGMILTSVGGSAITGGGTGILVKSITPSGGDYKITFVGYDTVAFDLSGFTTKQDLVF